MPTYGKKSLQVRSELHPELALIFDTALELGYDHILAEGYRNRARQHGFFIAVPQLSKVDYPTVHNTRPCWAVDAYVYEHDKGADYDERQASDFAGFIKAVALMLLKEGKITHKIRCGNDWDKDWDINDQTFNDPGHFELVPNPKDVLNYFEV